MKGNISPYEFQKPNTKNYSLSNRIAQNNPIYNSVNDNAAATSQNFWLWFSLFIIIIIAVLFVGYKKLK
jgi:hypothetical protein